MILSYAYSRHQDALRASLRMHYQLDLRKATETLSLFDLADLVAWIPAGSAFWLATGGPASISLEARELRRVGFMLRVLDWRERGSKGEKPKPDPEPEWAWQRSAAQEVANRKAAAYLRRQERHT